MKARLALAALLGASAFGSAWATPIALVNPGFESNWVSASFDTDSYVNFYYQPTGPGMGWTFGTSPGFTSHLGVANNYAWLHAQEGTRFAFLNVGTEVMSQDFTVAVDGRVDLSFLMSRRPGTMYPVGQVVRVLLDGNTLAEIAASAVAGWEIKTLDLGTLTAGTHTLGFKGLANYFVVGPAGAYLDDVRLNYTAPTSGGSPNGASVPEPMPLALSGLALLAAAMQGRRRRV